jgi:hypothetical protein
VRSFDKQAEIELTNGVVKVTTNHPTGLLDWMVKLNVVDPTTDDTLVDAT